MIGDPQNERVARPAAAGIAVSARAQRVGHIVVELQHQRACWHLESANGFPPYIKHEGLTLGGGIPG